MSKITDWLELQLCNHGPADGLEGGEYGRRVQAIAQAVSALRGNESTIFGMMFSGKAREEAAYLEEPFTKGLRDWRSFMEERLGNEGRTFVEDFAFHHDIQLDELKTSETIERHSLDRETKDILSSFLDLASEPKRLTEAWRKYDQLLEATDTVMVWAGLPSEKELSRMAEVYEDRFDAKYPSELGFVLSHLNGIAIHSSEPVDREGTLPTMIPASELGEPNLWSSTYGDQLMFEGLDLDPSFTFYVFGEIADSGYIALGIDQNNAPEVFWLDRELSAIKPHAVAKSLTDFFALWTESGLNLPQVLKTSHTPGW